jgi:hypothetical protein
VVFVPCGGHGISGHWHQLEGANVLVTNYYINYLDRAPDGAGLLNWTTQFQSGVQSENIAAAFIGSDEYFLLIANP